MHLYPEGTGCIDQEGNKKLAWAVTIVARIDPAYSPSRLYAPEYEFKGFLGDYLVKQTSPLKCFDKWEEVASALQAFVLGQMLSSQPDTHRAKMKGIVWSML